MYLKVVSVKVMLVRVEGSLGVVVVLWLLRSHKSCVGLGGAVVVV